MHAKMITSLSNLQECPRLGSAHASCTWFSALAEPSYQFSDEGVADHPRVAWAAQIRTLPKSRP
jgi:hypothetical protein